VTRAIAAVLLLASGCTLLSDFDSYTFAEGDAAQLVDAGDDSAASLDAGDAAAVLDAAQLVDAGTDAAPFDPNAPDCCGVGCAQCRFNTANPHRCHLTIGWICSSTCPTCGSR